MNETGPIRIQAWICRPNDVGGLESGLESALGWTWTRTRTLGLGLVPIGLGLESQSVIAGS